jgi:hypothetical protein
MYLVSFERKRIVSSTNSFPENQKMMKKWMCHPFVKLSNIEACPEAVS